MVKGSRKRMDFENFGLWSGNVCGKTGGYFEFFVFPVDSRFPSSPFPDYSPPVSVLLWYRSVSWMLHCNTSPFAKSLDEGRESTLGCDSHTTVLPPQVSLPSRGSTYPHLPLLTAVGRHWPPSVLPHDLWVQLKHIRRGRRGHLVVTVT